MKPGFTLVAVLMLALGSGANTAIFSVVNAVFLRSLPYPEARRLTTIFGSNPLQRQATVSLNDFVEWRNQQQSFADMFAYRSAIMNLTGGRQPVRASGIAATAGFFATLGIKPIRGRPFLPAENQPGAGNVVVISHALWQAHFESDPDILGKTLKLDDESFAIIGVMPATFAFTQPADVIMPLVLNGAARASASLRVIARLQPGITHQQARAETGLIAQGLQQANPQPDADERLGVNVVPLQELVRESSQSGLLLLFGATALVLLIACANLANLLLARATSRRKEMAVRAALGASRWRLMRQVLTESVLLSLMGGAGGILLALWSVDGLLRLAPATLPRLNPIGIDGWALGFTLMVALLTGVLFGLAPALQCAQLKLTDALKDGFSAPPAGWGRFSLRKLLMVGQLALAVVLLVGAGLLLNSLVRLLRVDPGFAPEQVVTVNLRMAGGARYRTREQIVSFYERAIERLRALPGVSAVGTVNKLPLGARQLRGDFRIAGEPAPLNPKPVDMPTIGADYFGAMGIPLLDGRAFTQRDTAEAQAAVVISESMARRFFADRNPLGNRISFERDDKDQPIWLQIIGVVGDVRQEALAAQAQPTVYFPYTQTGLGLRNPYFVVRAAVEPTSLLAAVQREIQLVDPEMPIVSARTMQQVISASVSEQRFNTLLLAIFAGLALGLTVIGLYGVMSYSVAQRTHEIGIRMALGAEPRRVLRLVVGQGIRLSLLGVAIGLAAAFALTRVMSSLLYGVSATDPLTFGVVALGLVLVALAAGYVPARRATRVDPLVALRYQ